MTAPQQRQASATGPAVAGVDSSAATSFWVTIDGLVLPSFTECSGIGAQYAVEDWSEGGQNGFAHRLPGRRSYTDITLSRYVDASSNALVAWFQSVGEQQLTLRTARITAVDMVGRPLAHWDLTDVFPSRYTGPSFSAGATTAATESLELVHHGFDFTYTARSGA